LSLEESYASFESTVTPLPCVGGRNRGSTQARKLIKQQKQHSTCHPIEGFREEKPRQCAGIWSPADTSTHRESQDWALFRGHRTSQHLNQRWATTWRANGGFQELVPWQHLESNPIEREFHDEVPRPPVAARRQESNRRYCSCLCPVTPECGAWRRASGLCSFAKEEGKPQSQAQRAPAHMKRERESKGEAKGG
jgi:hypothetical protein